MMRASLPVRLFLSPLLFVHTQGANFKFNSKFNNSTAPLFSAQPQPPPQPFLSQFHLATASWLGSASATVNQGDD